MQDEQQMKRNERNKAEKQHCDAMTNEKEQRENTFLKIYYYDGNRKRFLRFVNKEGDSGG